ncbi:SIR2 family protein [Mucilaginibacter sp. HMF5004]|uniref:SIR2 family protein n=1 Tax=Mucilaginibacter rivuli TaxID=2857527 RepID=UPI001C600242|nr:SIR2 family protein [Mucilaginibacter rivuli]MBW4890725.1 SIR2 family protein [Mucilaginibacter rivuli]
METTLIVGSGVSYVSGIPGIKEITSEIMSGENIGRAADGNYYFGQGQPYLKNHVSENILLINIVSEVITRFFDIVNVKHEINYEDIYYAINQILDSIYFEYENPAIFPFIDYLKNHESIKDKNLLKIVRETIKYIQCVVGQMANYKIKTLEQYNLIPELIDQVNLKNIITLNHDLVLDKYLEANNLKYFDGFFLDKYKFQNWKGFNDFDNSMLKVCKIHGSIDWYDLHICTKDYEDNEVFKIPSNSGIYIQRIRDYDDQLIGPNNGARHLLIGSFNKMIGYLGGVFESLYDEYRKTLTQSSKLIVSGYGFGDKGINSKLSLWLNLDSAVQMIIIHPSKIDLIKYSRGNFRNNFINENSIHPKIRFIEKKFEDLTIDELTDLH